MPLQVYRGNGIYCSGKNRCRVAPIASNQPRTGAGVLLARGRIRGSNPWTSIMAKFVELAELADRLAAAPKKLEKRALIAAWLKGLSPEDAALGAMYLAGTPFAETDRRALNVGGAQLSK